MSLYFPKNVVVVLSTHGEIIMKDGRPDIIKVPEPIRTISKLNFAPIGACTVSREIKTARFGKLNMSADMKQARDLLDNVGGLGFYRRLLEQQLSSMPDIGTTEDTLQFLGFLESVREASREIYSQRVASIANSGELEGIPLEEACTAADLMDLHFNIHLLNRGDDDETQTLESWDQFVHSNKVMTMINKLYTLGSSDHSPEPMYGIVAMNVPGRPMLDLLPLINGFMGKPSRTYRSDVTIGVETKDILAYFAAQPGVQNLIMVDMTCSIVGPVCLQREYVEQLVRQVSPQIGYGTRRKRRVSLRKRHRRRGTRRWKTPSRVQS